MKAPKSYRDLKVWQMAMSLASGTYELTSQFPRHELYGLTGQIRRAAVSVPANIAEGRGRFSRGDFAHHASIARGSLMELDTHLEIAIRLNYVQAKDVEPLLPLVDQVSRMLTTLIRTLRIPK